MWGEWKFYYVFWKNFFLLKQVAKNKSRAQKAEDAMAIKSLEDMMVAGGDDLVFL